MEITINDWMIQQTKHWSLSLVRSVHTRHWRNTRTKLNQSRFKHNHISVTCRSQWPRGLRRRSAAARLLRLWARIPPGAWMCVSCECCVFLGRGLCDELITRPEEFYSVVHRCDLETSWMRRPWAALGRSARDRERERERLSVGLYMTLFATKSK